MQPSIAPLSDENISHCSVAAVALLRTDPRVRNLVILTLLGAYRSEVMAAFSDPAGIAHMSQVVDNGRSRSVPKRPAELKLPPGGGKRRPS